MKKIIPALAVLITTLMLSGCVIFWPDEYTSRYTSRYSITCYNDRQQTITDWCVVKNNQVTYAISRSQCCPINPGRSATINNLPEGNYTLYVSFTSNPDYENGDYSLSRPFTLNRNCNVHIDDTY